MSAASPGTPPPTESLSSPVRRRTGTIGVGIAIAIAVLLLLVGIGAGYSAGNSLSKTRTSSSTTLQLTETGSSLLYPLMVSWGPNYTAYNSQVVLAPESTGSGTGQSYAESGLVNIGASDAFLSNASVTNLINFPVAISAQLIYYNLPGITAHLNLNGTVIAMIYGGAITTWDNPLILAAQAPGVQTQLKALASETIVPLKRSDSSGDTFLFSSLCYLSWTGWPYKFSTGALSGSPWTGETGNSGMVKGLQTTVDSIGYVGISYENGATGITYAAVGDNSTLANGTYAAAAANYILPSAANISEDANLGLTHLQFSHYQLAVSLILGGSPAGAVNRTAGAGGTAPGSECPYPIVNLEYALIKTSPTGTTVTATALQATVLFLQWAISHGNYAPSGAASSYIDLVNFIPLTPEVIGYDQQELASIQG
ncbi:MAG: substrate-binding domain-containing protein [Thermoplasmata archaeon]